MAFNSIINLTVSPLMFLARFFPVITIVKIVGIAYVSLASVAFVSGILGLYISMVFPGIALVHYGFITPIPVEVAKSWREYSGVNPCAIVKINILMYINLVVRVDIRHVIITGMVIANRPPIRLIAYVYAYTKPHLCISGFEEKTSH